MHTVHRIASQSIMFKQILYPLLGAGRQQLADALATRDVPALNVLDDQTALRIENVLHAPWPREHRRPRQSQAQLYHQFCRVGWRHAVGRIATINRRIERARRALSYEAAREVLQVIDEALPSIKRDKRVGKLAVGIIQRDIHTAGEKVWPWVLLRPSVIRNEPVDRFV